MQESLFGATGSILSHETHHLDTATIEEYRHVFDEIQSALLFSELLETTPWLQDRITIAGKSLLVPRLQCWMGDASSVYSYSGIRLKPVAWSAPVLAIRSKIKELCGLDFNSVLLNQYRSGQDSVAWHADDEPELGPDPVIASVSLGASRTLQLCPKNTSSRAVKAKIPMLNGSVLIMGKGLQNNWLHQVPKAKSVAEARINLTFRHIRPSS